MRGKLFRSIHLLVDCKLVLTTIQNLIYHIDQEHPQTAHPFADRLALHNVCESQSTGFQLSVGKQFYLQALKLILRKNRSMLQLNLQGYCIRSLKDIQDFHWRCIMARHQIYIKLCSQSLISGLRPVYIKEDNYNDNDN